MQSEKMCVVLLFGGMSSEHEVSRVSVGNFVNNICLLYTSPSPRDCS